MNNNLVNNITHKFTQQFSSHPILIKSPGRINLIGEHTDYNDGFVFPAAIDKAIIAAIQKSETAYCTAIAIDENESFEFSLNAIQAIPNGGWKNYVLGVVAEIQKKGIEIQAFNLIIGGNIPLGAGLSSSAALENSIVFGLNELYDLGLSRNEMILISQMSEHNYAMVKCGIMDMYASMFGKQNSALLLDCRTIEAKDYKIDLGEYQIVLINTNVKHSLNDTAYNNRREVCEKTAKMLDVKALRDATEQDLEKVKAQISDEDFQKALYVIQENKRVLSAAQCIEKNDIQALGRLLYQSHAGLQNQYKVSCPELDFLVDMAKLDSAVAGARMMGGGFGGCTLNIVKKNAINAFTTKLSSAYKSAFNKECSVYFVELSAGTHRITE